MDRVVADFQKQAEHTGAADDGQGTAGRAEKSQHLERAFRTPSLLQRVKHANGEFKCCTA